MKKMVLGLFVRRDEGVRKLLLGTKHAHAKLGANTKNGPGGVIEEGETPAEAMIRESVEEVGLRIRKNGMEHVATLRVCVAGKLFSEVYVFMVTAWDGDLVETREMGQLAWHPFNAIPFDDMLEGDRFWLPNALFGNRLESDLFYERTGVRGPEGYLRKRLQQRPLISEF